MRQAECQVTELTADAVVIEHSWQEPEQFAVLFDRHAPRLANDLGKGVFFLMEETYLRPDQEAALYQLMARTPGFTIVPGVRAAIGRVGVGVEWTFEGGKGAVIFDPKTYAFLGIRTWPVPGFHGPGAHQYDGSALVKLAVVDKPGELP